MTLPKIGTRVDIISEHKDNVPGRVVGSGFLHDGDTINVVALVALDRGHYTPDSSQYISTIPVHPDNFTVVPTCNRCEGRLDADGFCPDETCPYSDHLQTATYTEG